MAYSDFGNPSLLLRQRRPALDAAYYPDHLIEIPGMAAAIKNRLSRLASAFSVPTSWIVDALVLVDAWETRWREWCDMSPPELLWTGTVCRPPLDELVTLIATQMRSMDRQELELEAAFRLGVEIGTATVNRKTKTTLRRSLRDTANVELLCCRCEVTITQLMPLPSRWRKGKLSPFEAWREATGAVEIGFRETFGEMADNDWAPLDLARLPSLPDSPHEVELFDDSSQPAPPSSSYLDLQLDENNRKVFRNGCSSSLTPNEWKLLKTLHDSRGEICSFSNLENAWADSQPTPDNRQVQISRLNAKIKLLGIRAQSDRKLGYKLVEKSE